MVKVILLLVPRLPCRGSYLLHSINPVCSEAQWVSTCMEIIGEGTGS